MGRTVTIRQSLVRSLILIILGLSALILATTIFGARRSVRTLSESLVDSTIDRTVLKLREFFAPIHQSLHMAEQWGTRGLLDIDQPPEQLNRLFMPVLQQNPQMSSVLIADSRGREYMLMRTADGWAVRQTRVDEWGGRTLWRTWTADNEQPSQQWREQDYDPRDRLWFSGAVEQAATQREPGSNSAPDLAESSVHWTSPYRFFTTKEPGITASLTFDRNDELTHVVAFDVLLTSIADYTTKMNVSAHGGLVVLTQDGRIVGLPRIERYEDPAIRTADLLKRPADLDWDLAVQATRAFQQRDPDQNEIVRFESEGKTWWSQTHPFNLTDSQTLFIAVIVPETDMLGDIPTMRLWIIGVTAAVLALGIWRVMVLARRYSEPIESLVEQSNRISQGDLDDVEHIDSNVAEVNQLAEAHERMREGLRSLLKLERDLQLARQIQQSTFPEQLPVVDGFDLAAWNDPADETGGDSYDIIGVRKRDQSSSGKSPARDKSKSPQLGALHAESAILMLADATGHGIGPALSATQIRAMLRMAVRMNADLLDIALHLNEQLTADLPESRFITAWLGLVDGKTGTLTSFSAGQGPILYYDAASKSARRIDVDAPPFGITEQIEYQLTPPLEMQPGDVVAVLSDGLFEATNADGQQFGSARVEEVIARQHEQSANGILTAIRWSLREFTANVPHADDQTAIIIKRV